MNTCQPPDCPCFCPSADLPLSLQIVPQGGPGTVIVLPIFGSQPFSAKITLNPILPVTLAPLIASVQFLNGNELTITTVAPNIAETLGTYNAQIQVCNACGELTIDLSIEVVVDLNPVITSCLLAQALWTPEARVPTVGDTLLAFTPAGCRALLSPDSACAQIQAFPGVVPTLVTQLATADCGLATVSDVLALIDFCAPLQAFPVALPGPLDTVYGQQAGVCSQFTIFDIAANVDICTLLQNLPNAVVQPTAVFYGQQGGQCFEFAVSDLAALIGVTCPLLATCDGSCAAPAYSFASQPASGMWMNGGILTLSTNNCFDFIEIGASITLQTAASNITANAGVDFIAVGANDATLQASVGTARMLGAGGTAVVQIDPVGNITAVNSTGAALRVLSTGSAVAMTAGLALELTSAGELLVNANPGVATQVLTSSGPGLPPTWQPAGGITFPLLAPDGSCAAPSYSFASSPDSGMFYDPTGVGSVIIGDDNCADFISVGASVVMQTATLGGTGANITLSNSTATNGAGITLTAGNSSGGITGGKIQVSGGTDVGNVTGGVALIGGTNGNLIGGGVGTGSWFGSSGPPAFLVGGRDTAGSGQAVVVRGGRGDVGTGGTLFLAGGPGAGANGNVTIRSGDGTFGLLTHVVFDGSTGDWVIGGTSGSAGEAIVSGGPGVPPTWSTPSATVPLNDVQDAAASAVRDHGTHTFDWAFDFENSNSFIWRDRTTTDPRLVVGAFSSLTGRRGDGKATLYATNAVGAIQASVAANSHPTQPNVLTSAAVGATSSTIDVRNVGIQFSSNGSNGLISGIDRQTFRNTVGRGQLQLGTFSALFFSAGNLVVIDGAANGSPPTIRAEGTADADIGLSLLPKGTGSVLAPVLTVTTDNGERFTGQTSGAGASVGTLTNAPSAGNPAFWLRVVINGVNHFIPAWT